MVVSGENQRAQQLRRSRPVTELVRERFSCRRFKAEPISHELQTKLSTALAEMQAGVFGTRLRFGLIAAKDQDSDALRGLGTYGFIRQPAGFVVGARQEGPYSLEDFGYRMEEIALALTDWGLGSCWLGGTFTKSSFASRVQLESNESIPAILAIGMIENEPAARQGIIRSVSGRSRRYPWEQLFFDQDWNHPLDPSRAGDYAQILELVRLAPSASNKQPWRVLLRDGAAHFFLKRTKGYRNLLTRMVQIEDMQRIDMGIALCHFEAGAREAGILGGWSFRDEWAEIAPEEGEYLVSWMA